jgi:parvulin-like peptidyl-prolyl isomerase
MSSHRVFAAFAVSAVLLLGGCADLTSPGDGAPPPQPDQAPAGDKPADAPPTPAPAPSPTPAAAPEPEVAASHILIQYKGSMRAPATITRTKEEAKKLATDVMNKAKKGADFAALAGQYSDEPGAKERGGSLGKFTRPRMVKPFADAAFALKPGEISGLVETDFGFHVIKRTE